MKNDKYNNLNLTKHKTDIVLRALNTYTVGSSAGLTFEKIGDGSGDSIGFSLKHLVKWKRIALLFGLLDIGIIRDGCPCIPISFTQIFLYLFTQNRYVINRCIV